MIPTGIVLVATLQLATRTQGGKFPHMQIRGRSVNMVATRCFLFSLDHHNNEYIMLEVDADGESHFSNPQGG
jgi:hypothetical protein